MAKRFCDTEIWDKDWFMKLSCKHKCLIRFIFDKCDVAGIWEPNWTLASLYVGEQCSTFDLAALDHQLKKLAGGKIFVLDFISFQYGTLSEKCNPHLKVISILKKHNLFQEYLKGTLGVKDKEQEEDMEEDKGGAGGNDLEQNFNELENYTDWKIRVMKGHALNDLQFKILFDAFRTQCLISCEEKTIGGLQGFFARWIPVHKEKYLNPNKNGKSEKYTDNTNALKAGLSIADTILDPSGNTQG